MKHSFFFFNDTATTEIYTLSLHDALPISHRVRRRLVRGADRVLRRQSRAQVVDAAPGDRKSTRLNSSHVRISYAVFCLKKKNHFLPSRVSVPRSTGVLPPPHQ